VSIFLFSKTSLYAWYCKGLSCYFTSGLCVERTYIKNAFFFLQLTWKFLLPQIIFLIVWVFAHSYGSCHNLGFACIDQILDHLLTHLYGNPNFHQTSPWTRLYILMLLPLAFQNRDSLYANLFADCVEWTKIIQWW
jgi:hypothetical protein